MDVEGDSGNFKGGVFLFAGPDELRVEMRIVGVGFAGSNGRIGFRSDEADGWIVNASFAFVVVLLDGTLGGLGFGGLLRNVLMSVLGIVVVSLLRLS